VAGTSVAAARVAAGAALLRERLGRAAAPAEVAARLVETATPRGPLLAAGAGTPNPARAAAATALVEPALVQLPRPRAHAPFTARATVRVRNTGLVAATLTPRASLVGTTVTVSPAKLTVGPHATAAVTVAAAAKGAGRPAGYATGTLTIGSASARLALAIGPPPPAPLSPLRLVARAGHTHGVRFTAGAATPAGGALAVQPLGDLSLAILTPGGSVVRQLTPVGGARDVLPGEYAYTLTTATMRALRKGPYRFRATAHGPAGGPPVVRTSPAFKGR
jgi:hypothetical protein